MSFSFFFSFFFLSHHYAPRNNQHCTQHLKLKDKTEGPGSGVLLPKIVQLFVDKHYLKLEN